MTTQRVEVMLRAYFEDGRAVAGADFVDLLDVGDADGIVEVIRDRGPWHSSLLVFSRHRLERLRRILLKR